MGEQKIRVVLISADRQSAAAIRSRLEEEEGLEVVATLESLPGAERMPVVCAHWHPDALFVDVSDLRRGMQVIESIRRCAPEIPCVTYAPEIPGTIVVDLLRAGAADCLQGKPESWAIQNLVIRLSRLRTLQPSGALARGRVIGFTSLKPGSGATTLAAQSAFALRRGTGGKVLLLDLNLASGTSELWADRHSDPPSIVDALNHMGKLGDAEGWDACTVGRNGVHILPAPHHPAEAPPPPEAILRLIGLARQWFDWIVVDLPSSAEALALQLAPELDEIIAVSTPELTSLHLAQRQLGWLSLAGVPPQALRLALNRTQSCDLLPVDVIERTLGRPVDWCLPNDYFSLYSAGHLALTGESPLAQAIRGVAAGLAAPPPQKPAIPTAPEPALAPA